MSGFNSFGNTDNGGGGFMNEEKKSSEKKVIFFPLLSFLYALLFE
jgi:hypothetical protein